MKEMCGTMQRLITSERDLSLIPRLMERASPHELMHENM